MPNLARFTSQPQYLAAIDWSHPSAAGLAIAVNGTSTYNAATKSNFTEAAGPITTGSMVGLTGGSRGWKFASASSQYLTNSNNIITGFPLTFLTVSRWIANGAAQCFVAISDNASRNYHTLYISNGGTPFMFSVNLGTLDQASGTAITDSNPFVIVGRVSGAADRVVFVNGVKGTTNTTSVSPTAAQNNMIGAYLHAGVVTSPFNEQISLTLAWNRALSDGEIVMLSKNPWQLFKAPERRIFPQAGAGGATFFYNPISGRGGTFAQPLAVH